MNNKSVRGVHLGHVQKVRKAVLFLLLLIAVFFISVTASRWESGSFAHEAIEWAGLMLIVFCIIGRTWASLYIGGRKSKELVQHGPYSVSRNPLYLFTFIGAAGIGAQLGSAMLAFAAAFVAWIVFSIVTIKEEQVLQTTLGGAYRDYLARVPRFFPDFRLFRDLDIVEINPRLVWRTFIDACVFLLSIPLAEGFEHLQHTGVLPVLFRLP